MKELEIWPEGDFEFGHANIGGQDCLMLKIADRKTDTNIFIGFTAPAFVAFADHVKMVADEMVDQIAKK